MSTLDLPPFPSYRIDQRREELERLGLSPPVIRLALFDPPHPLFRERCGDLGPPLPEWRDHQPRGAPMSYLWCHRGLVTGARAQTGPRFPVLSGFGRPTPRPEFLLFLPALPCTAYAVIARSEQGLLASVFAGLIEDQSQFRDLMRQCQGSEPFPEEEWEALQSRDLRAAAGTVGFKYLTDVETFWRKYGGRDDFAQRLYAYTRTIR
jgi:hypothetical protein